MVTFVKKINIKDVVYRVAEAWDDIPSSTITKSWNMLLGNASPTTPASESQNESSDKADTCHALLQQLDSNLTSGEISEWISSDADDPGHQVLSDEDIVREVLQPQHDEVIADLDNEEDQQEENTTVVTHGKAAEMYGVVSESKLFCNGHTYICEVWSAILFAICN